MTPEIRKILEEMTTQGVDIHDRDKVVALAGHSSHEGATLNGIHPDAWEDFVTEEKPRSKRKKADEPLDETTEDQ